MMLHGPTHLSLLMVDHHIMRLDIPVHDAFAVAKVQRLEKLEDVVPHIVVHKPRIQRPEVCVVHILEYQAGRFALAISHYIQQGDNIGSSRQILQDFDLSLYLLLLDRLQDFDDAFLVVDDIDPLEYFRVFPSSYRVYCQPPAGPFYTEGFMALLTNLSHHFVILQYTP
jgi:hypothetical protein